MHQNQLRFFEDLMLQHTEATPVDKSKKPHVNFDVSVIEQEKSSVLQYLRELKFSIAEEKQLAWVVNAYLERVIDLINRAHVFTSSQAKTKKVSACHSAMDALQEILLFLVERYGKYMDMSAHLPIPGEIQLKDLLVTVFLQFRENIQMCPVLLEVIESVYADFAAAEECGKTSYYRMFYLLAFIRSLQKATPATDNVILNTLIAFNFNCPAFIAYYKQKLLEHPETLTFSLKEINQVNIMPGLALNRLLPSVQEQLSAWITQEIAFRGNIQTNEAALPAAHARKISITLSVAQLGHMLKLFSDLGVLVDSNKTELLETIASMFRTEKVENISPASLRNSFYNENASVSRSIRDLLLAALNKIQRK